MLKAFIFLLFLTFYTTRAEIFCQLCKELVTAAEQEDPNDLKHYLETKTKEVCSKLPLPFDISDECLSFFEKYYPIISELLSLGVSPEAVCQHVGVCKQ
uniref:Saposin B-type domain-containing protein n=1 Tax=Caenorhabditis japonica TaxID=281687 RepID=A0A8R1I156_CAEJA